jgi:N-acetylglucosamine-6-sulfatase
MPRPVTMAAATSLALGLGLLGTVSPTPASQAAALRAAGGPARPNVLLITADDMRAGDLRFMPFTRGEFRRRAVTFSDAVSPYPLCCPARAQILTGQYNHNNGVRGNGWPNGGHWALRRRGDTLPTWLQLRGYRTAFVGKYLNQYGTDPDGYRDPRGLLDGRRRFEVPPGWTHWFASVAGMYQYTSVQMNIDTPGRRAHRRSVSRYQTRYFSDVTTSLIRRYHQARKPFFIWASHLAPHMANRGGRWVPPVPAARDRGVHRRTRLPAGRAYRAALNAPTGSKRAMMADRTPVSLSAVRRLYRARAESLRSLDRAVRAAVRQLKRTGEYANTVILFTSDNGYMLGEHRYIGKDMPYEPALRVPMVVNAPGLKHRYVPRAGARARVTVPHTVTITDVASTIVGVTGARPGRLLDGLDMTRPRQNPDHGGGDRVVLVESGAKGGRVSPVSRFVGVRSNRWTWFGWFARPGGVESWHQGVEFYDRGAEPAQTRNLIAPSADKRRMAQLAWEMRDCRGAGCMRSLR